MSCALSIITPWLDRPEFIADYERAVASPDTQVIVVDNGSARLAAESLQAMIGRLNGIYIRNDANRWFSGANNQGLAAASGRIVLFMNNDIVASANWLEEVKREVQPGGLYGPSLRSRIIEQTEIRYIEGWCVAGLRQVWHGLDGWNEHAFQMPYWEDTELCWRAAQAGIEMRPTHWAVAHKVNGTSATVAMASLGIQQNRAALVSVIQGQGRMTAEPAKRLPQPPQPLEAYLKTCRLSDAEQDYLAAIEKEPSRADLRLAYSRALLCCGRSEAAHESFQEALRLNPAMAPDAYTEIGIVFDTLGRFDESAAAFSQVVRRRPESYVARCNWAAALIRAGKFEQAADVAQEAINLSPLWAQSYGELSHALLRSGRMNEALDAARKGSRLEPPSATVYYVLGVTLKAAGQLQEALAALDRAAALNPAESGFQIHRQQVVELLNEKKR